MAWVLKAMLLLIYAQKEPGYPLYKRLGGTQGWYGQVWRSLAPHQDLNPEHHPGLTNHYTDYAILALSYPSKVI